MKLGLQTGDTLEGADVETDSAGERKWTVDINRASQTEEFGFILQPETLQKSRSGF